MNKKQNITRPPNTSVLSLALKSSIGNNTLYLRFALLVMILIVSMLSNNARAQCTNTTAYGTVTAPTAGATATITTAQYATEYATINTVAAATTYRSTSSIATDFLTVHQGSYNGPVIAFGLTPLYWTSTVAGTYYVHCNTNAACGTATTNRTTTITHMLNVVPITGNNSITTCSGNLYDMAGAAGNYTNNCNGYTVVYPATAGNMVRVSGTSAGESCCDYVQVYNGVGTGGTLLGTYYMGTAIPTLTSTDASGALTVRFYSDVSVGGAGFNIAISCYAPPICGTCPTYNFGPYTPNASWQTHSSSIVSTGCKIYAMNLTAGLEYVFKTGCADGATADFDTYLELYDAACANVAFNDDGCESARSTITYTAPASGTYYLKARGYGSNFGNYTMAYRCTPPANDLCANAISIGAAVPYTSAIINNTAASDDAPVTTCDGPYKNVWWTVTGVCGTMTANTCTGNTNFDSEIAVFTGSCGSMTQVGCNDDACGVQSSVTWNATAGTTYYISVGSYYSSGSTGNLQLNVTAITNILSVEPTSISGTASLCPGASSTLTAVGGSDGTGAVLEWFTGSCGGTPAGTGASITVTPTSNTTYFVRRAGTCNTTACASLAVSVNYPSATTPTAMANTDYVWGGRLSSDWSTAANWMVYNGATFSVAASIPTAANNVYFRALGGCAINTCNISAANATCNSLVIESGNTLIMSGGRTLYVAGNWTNTGSFTAGDGRVTFFGSNNQGISAGGNSFYKVVFSNNMTGSSDINVMQPMNILDSATFVNGIVYFTATGAMNFANNAKSNGGTAGSFVNGTVAKTGANAFVFPVGKVSGATAIWAPLEISAPGSAADKFSCTYFFSSAPNNWAPADMCNVTQLDHTSGVEYWNLSRDFGSASPTVTLYWKNALRSGITNVADLVVAHYEPCPTISDPQRWKAMATVASGTTGASGTGTAVGSGFTNYSPITFGTKVNSNPLPVTLLDFSANCEAGSIALSWSTASETNNDYFTVERSSDATNWQVLTTTNGAGNSNSISAYRVVDNEPLDGRSYYRLSQTDYDGRSETFNMVSPNCEETLSSISYYPNPFNSKLSIQMLDLYAEQASITIFDITGRVMITKVLSANDIKNTFLILNLGELANGVYTIEYRSDAFYDTQKIVKH